MKKLPIYAQDILVKIRKLTKEKIELEEEYNNLKHSKLLYYRTEFPITLKSNEIKDFIDTDNELNVLLKKIKEIDNDIEYHKEELKNINQTRWDIKNFIEWYKLLNGIV